MCSTLDFVGVFLFLSCVKALPSDLWHISIDEGPAPAPQDGPPLSASAIRDKSYLPGQIGSIVGAYILVVIIVGASLSTVGRRLRRSAQESPRTLAMEMLKPVKTDGKASSDVSPVSPTQANPYRPSPISTINTKAEWPSPKKTGGWFSPTKGHRQHPSTQSSVITFDESVIEDDRAKNQIEMERLYAAVSEHDEQMSKSASESGDRSSSQRPPELQHLRFASSVNQPLSPPPEDTSFLSRMSTTSPRQTGSKMSKPSPISMISTNTHSRASSRTSLGSFSKKRGIKHLPISPPMGSPDLAPDNMQDYGEAEPLSPRTYAPGPPPPTPPQLQASIVSQMQSQTTLPDPRRFEARNTPRSPQFQVSRTSSLNMHDSPAQSPGTTNNPIFQSSHDPSNQDDAQSQQSTEPSKGRHLLFKPQRKPTPLTLGAQSTTSSSNSLPLRSAPLPLRNMNTKYSDRPKSTIKATVLERKAPPDRHLRTPMTGVPMTPYSPYMPFTPLTPMTPSHLVTREERKRRVKEEGRRIATAEDRVIEEADMWGDAYH